MSLIDYLRSVEVVKIGHRGAPGMVTENTMASFKEAQVLGANAIELDVQLTRDLIPVIHHDHSLKRIFSIDSKINELTMDELRTVCPEIPTLNEILNEFEGFPLNIELKKETFDVSLVPHFWESIKSTNVDYCWFSSFNASLLYALKRLQPSILVGYLLPVPWMSKKSALKRIKQLEPIALHCHYKQLTSTLMDLKTETSLPVYSYTATSKEEHEWMLEKEVNGIFTNTLSLAHEICIP